MSIDPNNPLKTNDAAQATVQVDLRSVQTPTECLMKKPRVTMPTSAKHAILLDTAIKRTADGTQRHDFLLRLGRSLDMFGSLTPAVVAACVSTISPSSKLELLYDCTMFSSTAAGCASLRASIMARQHNVPSNQTISGKHVLHP
jgi:hypothetical protein